MKKNEITVGGFYTAKVGNNLTVVRVDSVKEAPSYGGKITILYSITNMRTGRKTTFRSAMKFRGKAADPDAAARKAQNESDARWLATKEGKDAAAHPVAVEDQVVDNTAEIECQDSPNGKHEFTPDLEYDSTGQTINCRYCGETEDEQSLDPTPSTTLSQRMNGVPFAESPSNVATVLRPSSSSIGERLKSLGQPRSSTPSEPHMVVAALAGTGKTTTIVEGMKVIKGLQPQFTPSPQQQCIWDCMKQGKADNIRFVAFSKAIATELQERVTHFGLDKKGCEASTLHSMGYKAVMKALGRMEVSEWVVKDLVCEALGVDFRDLKKDDPAKLGVVLAAEKLVGLCKMNLTTPTPENLHDLAAHYEVDIDSKDEEQVYALIPTILQKCRNPRGKIDFGDMVWLPVVLDLPLWKSDMLLVDERQDLSACQQQLAYKAGHRIVAVGDKFQAIFGFGGADAAACDNMDSYLYSQARGMVEFPLTVTRRCGKKIVAEAQELVPQFEAHPSNPEGEIGEALYTRYKQGGEWKNREWEKTFGPMAQPGDFVLCRCNAPLVSTCFQFLKRGIKANILGRNVGDGLLSLVKRLKATDTKDLITKVTCWQHEEVGKEQAKRNPSDARVIAIQDKADCLTCFTEGASSVDAVLQRITDVFTDKKDSPGIRLSSCHRSKGLESKRVFFLEPEGATCPHPMARAEWQKQQELNLRYVSLTRGREELIYVS